MDEILGVHKVETGVGTGGVGFVVVPDENNREQYINDCYRTNTLTINGGTGYGFFSAVPCPPDVLQNITFPTDLKRGTPVIWIRDGFSNLPVIVNWLRQQGDYYYMGENKFRLSRGVDKKSIDIYADGEVAELQINILGDKLNPSLLKIKVNSENKDSEINVSCDNLVSITGIKELKLNSHNKVSISVLGDNAIPKGLVKYEAGIGFNYEDEFGNKVSIVDGEAKIISKKINLGEGKEQLVLGNTLVQTLSDLIDAILALTVTTPVGPSSPPINSIQFTSIKSKLNTVLSKLSNTD